MSTSKQNEANRANAEKSTGPRTEEGKARCATNRRTHGFCSKTTLIPREDAAELELLLDNLADEYEPANTTEHILLQQMAHSRWLSLRAIRLQARAFEEHMDEPGLPKELSLLYRYQTSNERSFHKAHNELLKAQKERKKPEIGSEPEEPEGPDHIVFEWVKPEKQPGYQPGRRPVGKVPTVEMRLHLDDDEDENPPQAA